jgi:ABC-type arginine transport system ATPase subunit
VIIEDGVIIEEGRDVLTNPRTERAKRFLGYLSSKM